MTVKLGRIGVWAHASRFTSDVSRELEALGYGTIWVGGSPPADLDVVEAMLDATTRITVATGIVNVWSADPAETARSYHRLEGRYPGRFLLGVGAGHPEAESAYQRPYDALVDYLDILDAEGVPADRRVLAALGPRVLQLAADRTAGAHPYLTTPEHTRQARKILGPNRILAPEQKVVVDADDARGRSIGRRAVEKPYLGLSNYVANLSRLGFTDGDLAGSGSDRLIDALVGHGTAETASRRLVEHLDAGADHVAVQLLTEPGADPMPGYRSLATYLLT